MYGGTKDYPDDRTPIIGETVWSGGFRMPCQDPTFVFLAKKQKCDLNQASIMRFSSDFSRGSGSIAGL